MKICTGCKIKKPPSEFYPDRRRPNGRMSRCKTCKRDALTAWRKKTGADAKRYRKDPDAELERHLKRKYGITLSDYEEMFKRQLGRCGVCESPHGGGRRFDVDHDHETGEVRGLLCTSCNRMLGHAGDSPSRLVKGARYLQSFRRSRLCSS